MGHILSMVGYWIGVTCHLRDSLGVTLDPAAFPSAEILTLVSQSPAQAVVTKAACIAFLCYREAKPHHRREVLFWLDVAKAMGFFHIRAC